MELRKKTVSLPGGYFDSKGNLHKDCEIVEMSGKVRRFIAADKQGAKVIETVIGQCVSRMGTMENFSSAYVPHMCSGDADFLMIEIRRFSLGDEMHVDMRCGNCKALNRPTLNLGDLEFLSKTEDAKPDATKRTFTFEFEAGNVSGRMMVPTIGLVSAMSTEAKKNPIEGLHWMLGKCLIEFGGKTGPFNREFFDDLPASVLDEMIDAFTKHKFGYKTEVEVQCVECGAINKASFEGADFFMQRPA